MSDVINESMSVTELREELAKAQAELDHLRQDNERLKQACNKWEINEENILADLQRHKSCLEVARVSLSKVISGFDAKEIEEFRVSHEGCAGGEIFMDEVIECYDTIHQINEVLGGDSTKTNEPHFNGMETTPGPNHPNPPWQV